MCRAMTEFDIIRNFFAAQTEHRSDVILGIGDDSALVSVPAGHELAITTDTLTAGVHFPGTTLPYDIGYKALAVNLSDLGAMGAQPAWVTLAITLPANNEDWVQSFCDGFFTLANRYRVELIGGDLTRGPLSITVQALGFVPANQAVRRSGAKPGDLIYVTGTLGDAGLALLAYQDKIQLPAQYRRQLAERLDRPEPRIATGIALRQLAHAAIDISDGLGADLGHILQQSQVGARLNIDHLPLSDEVKHSLSHEEAIALALNAGDDYELCFTVAPNKQKELEEKLAAIPCRYTMIGTIEAEQGLACYYSDGRKYNGAINGYEHF